MKLVDRDRLLGRATGVDLEGKARTFWVFVRQRGRLRIDDGVGSLITAADGIGEKAILRTIRTAFAMEQIAFFPSVDRSGGESPCRSLRTRGLFILQAR